MIPSSQLKFKVGDLAFHIRLGWCKIINIMGKTLQCEDSIGRGYIINITGYFFESDLCPMLLSIEEAKKKYPEFTLPKTKKRVAFAAYMEDDCRLTLTSYAYETLEEAQEAIQHKIIKFPFGEWIEI